MKPRVPAAESAQIQQPKTPRVAEKKEPAKTAIESKDTELYTNYLNGQKAIQDTLNAIEQKAAKEWSQLKDPEFPEDEFRQVFNATAFQMLESCYKDLQRKIIPEQKKQDPEIKVSEEQKQKFQELQKRYQELRDQITKLDTSKQKVKMEEGEFDDVYDILCKVNFIGASDAGKTNLLQHIDSNIKQFSPTRGTEIHARYFNVSPTVTKLLFWDQAGKDTNQVLTTSQYQNTDVVAFVVNLDSAKTFDVEEQYNQFLKQQQYFDKTYPPRVVIIANKQDLESKEQIPSNNEKLNLLANKIGELMKTSSTIPVYRCSASQGTGVPQVFNDIAALAKQKHILRRTKEKAQAEKSQMEAEKERKKSVPEAKTSYTFKQIHDGIKKYIKGTPAEKDPKVKEFLDLIDPNASTYNWDKHKTFSSSSTKQIYLTHGLNNKVGGWYDAYRWSQQHLAPRELMGHQYESFSQQQRVSNQPKPKGP